MVSVAEFNKQHPRPAKFGARKHKFCKFNTTWSRQPEACSKEAPARFKRKNSQSIFGKTGKEHHVSPKVYKYLYDECEKAFEGEKIMPWSFIAKDDAVLTLWPGMKVRKAALDGILAWFETFEIEPMPVGCVNTSIRTLSSNSAEQDGVGENEGRVDFFFTSRKRMCFFTSGARSTNGLV